MASEEINYRRFFDVNQLAALCMEDPAVFDEVHRFALDLVHRGGPTGLRVDHIDGLYAPGEYLGRRQARCNGDSGESAAGPFFIVVEKILGAREALPRDWPVAGTTGYEFAAIVNNLFVDRRNEKALDDISTRVVRDRRERLSFSDLAYRSRKQVMHKTMSGDINSLGHQLNRFSERNRHFRRRDDDDGRMAAELLAERNDGRIKMLVTARALAARRHLRGAFAGEYLPLQTTGARQESVFAFVRRRGSEYAITCLPRLIASVIPDAAGPPLGAVWLDTCVDLPADAPSTLRDVLTGATIDTERGAGHVSDFQTIPAAALFERLPVALLIAP